MRRVAIFGSVMMLGVLISGGGLARAVSFHGKPPGPSAIVTIAPRSITPGGTARVAGAQAGLPAHGSPPVALTASARRALRAAMLKPTSTPVPPGPSEPAHGTFTRLVGSAPAAHGHAYWTGSRWAGPPGAPGPTPSLRPLPRLLVPRRPAGRAGVSPAFPSALYPSTQVDSPTAGCSNPFPNEPSVAQSSDNPNDVVVAAQAFLDSSGNCDDSHPWVFYSHDGGQHWHEEVMPGLTPGLAGGDVGVVYDAKDHVFVYCFLQFSRTTSTDSVNVASSFDGASWFDLTTLDAHPGALDKDMITVNQDPSSPRYGRVLVAWRDDSVGQNAFIDAYSDDGGGSWAGSSDSINIVPDCGNGVSPAFDANGDAMAAWYDCNGGTTIKEELSTDGGAGRTQPRDTGVSGAATPQTPAPRRACARAPGRRAFPRPNHPR